MVHLKEKLKAFLLLRGLRVKVMLGVVLILLIGMGTFTYIDVVSVSYTHLTLPTIYSV